MKRGRRSLRLEVKPLIMEIFKEKNVPLNPYQIKRIMEKDHNKKYAYMVVRKYCKELVKTGRLEIKFMSVGKNNAEFIFYYPKG